MKRSTQRNKGKGAGRALAAARVVGLGVTMLAAGSCNGFDTTRQGTNATLGDDIYGVMCDRVGASSIVEDPSGASYNAICHFDSTGAYGNKVDVTVLPAPSTPAETAARALSVAKLERMAQRRGDLIHAFNAIFPDVMMPDITSSNPNAQIRLHTALMAMTQALTPLYTSNPIDGPSADPLLPM